MFTHRERAALACLSAEDQLVYLLFFRARVLDDGRAVVDYVEVGDELAKFVYHPVAKMGGAQRVRAVKEICRRLSGAGLVESLDGTTRSQLHACLPLGPDRDQRLVMAIRHVLERRART